MKSLGYWEYHNSNWKCTMLYISKNLFLCRMYTWCSALKQISCVGSFYLLLISCAVHKSMVLIFCIERVSVLGWSHEAERHWRRNIIKKHSIYKRQCLKIINVNLERKFGDRPGRALNFCPGKSCFILLFSADLIETLKTSKLLAAKIAYV